MIQALELENKKVQVTKVNIVLSVETSSFIMIKAN